MNNEKLYEKWSRLKNEVNERGGDGEDFVSAMKELYELWSPDLYLWLAGLWDPAIGGFYFSENARDNEPFLPDIESTLQAIKLLEEFCIVDEPRTDLPPDMTKKIGEFLLSCFDPEDGYFYHPQWGKNIIAARRGRDLMWANGLMQRVVDIKLPAPTATERLKAASEGKAEEAAPLPDYLKSEKAIKEYLAGWNWDTLAYPSGNNLAAIQDQIISAGLAKAALDYMDSIQNAETGMWGSLVGYDAVNAYMKISSFYIAAGTVPRYVERAADSIISCLCSDEVAETMCYQYNVWFAISNILTGLRRLGGEGKAAADKIAAHTLSGAPAAIRKTREKILTFAIGDGSYAAGPSHLSSGQSQGAWVDIKGSVSGNINASIINSSEMLDKIYGALELRDFYISPFSKEEDLPKFIAALPRT